MCGDSSTITKMSLVQKTNKPPEVCGNSTRQYQKITSHLFFEREMKLNLKIKNLAIKKSNNTIFFHYNDNGQMHKKSKHLFVAYSFWKSL